MAEATVPGVAFREVTKEFATLVRRPRGGGTGAVRAVDRISFEVKEGELLVLLGPSGCGKTTTLRMLAGLEVPDSGEIAIGDRIVSSPARNISVPTEKRNIGMVFQSYAIWPHMTVFENVAFPLRVRGLRGDPLREKVERALTLVGLEGLDARSATRLSGGQQQRVALARALVFEPRLLLLDEPLSNLDAKLRVHMRGELKDLQRRTGITTVFVTHDQAESMALADRIIVMDSGRIQQVGTPQEIYETPQTRFVSEFVGSINLFSADVAPAGGPAGDVSLHDPELGQRIACAWGGDGVPAPGTRVLVSVRPESLHLGAAAPTGFANVWPCTITRSVYYGDHREYTVRVGGRTLRVTTPPAGALPPDLNAYVACHAADVHVMRE